MAERTLHPLLRLVQNRLITRHAPTLLRHDMFDPLAAKSFLDKSEIRLLYALLSKVLCSDFYVSNRVVTFFWQVDKLNALTTAFCSFIVRTGSALVKTGASESSTASQRIQFVPSLLKLKRDVDSVVALAFNKNENMVSIRKRAFEDFLNESPNKPGEELADFIDRSIVFVPKIFHDGDLRMLLWVSQKT